MDCPASNIFIIGAVRVYKTHIGSFHNSLSYRPSPPFFPDPGSAISVSHLSKRLLQTAMV